MQAPCLSCDHHISGKSKDCELCLGCAKRIEYARATDGDSHVIQLGPERDLPEKYCRESVVWHSDSWREYEQLRPACRVSTCERAAVTRDVCWRHYRAWRRGQAEVVAELGVFEAIWVVGEGRTRSRGPAEMVKRWEYKKKVTKKWEWSSNKAGGHGGEKAV